MFLTRAAQLTIVISAVIVCNIILDISEPMDPILYVQSLASISLTLLTLDTAPSHVKMCRWLTSLCPPLSISSIVVSL